VPFLHKNTPKPGKVPKIQISKDEDMALQLTIHRVLEYRAKYDVTKTVLPNFVGKKLNFNESLSVIETEETQEQTSSIP